ncbi:RecQ family ATP-dependent DNA helicase [Brevibacillus migulae]|uniref:RecQ family ATP-dependent DNA helicase n=1 Tax=Brevibacillus migulae TaxID=1644114 RepID=UPI00106DFF73|nr:ATP-dependent DNA helicase RecQ [Brevibacillus migulae]
MSMDKLEQMLSSHFGYSGFRGGQKEIVQKIMQGKNVLGILATGGGKSITYQLPALLLPGVTVVVSPLISLMVDQVQRIRQRRTISAAYINSALDPTETRKLLTEIDQGRYRLIYISPEKLQQATILQRLKRRGVSLLAIDEAHCISQWGHDFRVDYLRLPDAVQQLGNPPVLAVTATATQHVRTEICRLFHIDEADVIAQSVNRPNIAFDLIEVSSEAQKREHVLEAVKSLQGPGIVYGRTRQTVDQLAFACMEEGVLRAQAYHAGMSAMERVLIQEQFLSGELDVIFATNAFGMGIDKPDIRYVLHYHFPGSLEEYAQEVGRIGRDGKPGYAGLYLNPEDAAIHQYMLANEYPVYEEVFRFVQLLATSSGHISALELAAMAGLPDESLDMLFFYAEQHGLVSQLTKTKDQYRYRLEKVDVSGAAMQISRTLEELKRTRKNKLMQMKSWLHEKDCLRQALSFYFEGQRATEYTAQCCSCCGLDRSFYEQQPFTQIQKKPDHWDLHGALRRLLPVRKEKEAITIE